MNQSIKSILEDIIQEESDHAISVYTFDGINLALNELPVIMRDTILLELFTADQFLILHAERDSEVELEVFKAALERILAIGIEHENRTYKILGASSSLKDGKLWLATDEVRKEAHYWLNSSNEALAYLGILTTNCHEGIWNLTEDIEIVEDGTPVVGHSKLCTGDGMGFIPIDLMKQLNLPEQSHVLLTIYDILGREIRKLVNTTQDAGYKSVIWDGTDGFGRSVGTGIYLYQINAGDFTQTRKMLLLR